PLELSCLLDIDATETDEAKKGGTWHQATNSLRLILCERKDPHCKPSRENTVFFAVIHRKFPNYLDLPLRYERHFMVWSASPPFSMLGISQHPILMANETASGWTESQNWDDDPANAATVAQTRMYNNTMEPYGGKDYWAYFTYTVSIAYAWARTEMEEVGEKNVGFLDDEVVLGIGIDDKGQGFARARAGDLVQCLRACPGRGLRDAETFGIGLETTILFAREGASVLMTDISPSLLSTALNKVHSILPSLPSAQKLETLPCDVSKEADIAAAVSHLDSWGGVDVMFNNAGIMHADDADAVATEEKIWDLTMSINAKGVWWGCKYAVMSMRKFGKNKGSVINTASVVGLVGSATPQLAYTASKGAVLALTRELAIVHARENFRFNSLCPAPLKYVSLCLPSLLSTFSSH
ncbi:MAG: hypothetical protein Q9184_008222, partial [Pyrenodesmia sp. 2 TL-2023]